MSCAWKGELTAADLTCTGSQGGSLATILEVAGTTSIVLKASEVASDSLLQTVAIVTGTASPVASGSQPSGSQPAGNATASGSAPAATATGAAAGGPVPMGAMAFVGGAAGVFAAALAL